MVLPHLFMGEEDGNVNHGMFRDRTAVDPNGMRQAPNGEQYDPSASHHQQLQNMMMSHVVPPPNSMPFLKHQQVMSQQQSLPSMSMQGGLNGGGFQHNQQQQQQQQPPPSTSGDEYAGRFMQNQVQGGGAFPSDSVLAAMAEQQQQPHPGQQQYQELLQQQQRRESGDGLSGNTSFNMPGMGGYPVQQQQQQQHSFAQPWMAETQGWNKQPDNFHQDHLGMQQQQLSSQQQAPYGTNPSYFLQQRHQQQYLPPPPHSNFEAQKRRRSSVSSAGSLSPLRGNGMGEGYPGDYSRRYNVSPHAAIQAQQQDGAMMARGIHGQPRDGVMMAPMMRKDKKKRAKTFPEKLMKAMMENNNEDAVAWLPDGKSFVIVSPDLFVDEVLNNVFKQAKYASFVRKLHRWGFVRLTSGTGTDCFHHPLFNRNRRDMASKIACAPTKDKDMLQRRGHDKPPSLAGVERFIRAKAAAAAALAQEKAGLLEKGMEEHRMTPKIEPTEHPGDDRSYEDTGLVKEMISGMNHAQPRIDETAVVETDMDVPYVEPPQMHKEQQVHDNTHLNDQEGLIAVEL